jgi:hypothetical protein
LAKGKSGIECSSMEELIAALEAVKDAVAAGELVAQIDAHCVLALPRRSEVTDMRKYKATVRVRKASGSALVSVQATVEARNIFDAKALLEAQYGRGNVGVVAEVL